ncbi:hypothetical protein KSP40_PGU009935 [Platanthera guangdongensis]|uniref:TOG domain-containing protein n=1 Tax=Platanthera guangdongensis TaxID=2320717 RepID=A0ABR2LU74_9ASPA
MAGDGVKWDGLLKWSLSHADGTGPKRVLSDEERRWFLEAMGANSVDVIKRMKEITEVMKTPEDVLDAHGVTTAHIEVLASVIRDDIPETSRASYDSQASMFIDAKEIRRSPTIFKQRPHDVLNLVRSSIARLKSIYHNEPGLSNTAPKGSPNKEEISITGGNEIPSTHEGDCRGADYALAGIIECAKGDLHSIGGLHPLIGYLKNSNASIRAKAADVVTTIVQNNPKSQQLVMEASGLDLLLSNLSTDSDVTVRSKALGAISCITSTVTELGFLRLMVHLASSDDSSVREAALGTLLELAWGSTSEGGTSSFDEATKLKLKQILQHRIDDISSMDADDLRAAREERQLLDSLWSICCDEPSSLRDKGLLVLPGEETLEQPPDVAGKLFEPPLRAWAAANPPRPSTPEKKTESPLLLGPPGP